MKIGVVGIGRWGFKVAREYIELANEGVIDSVILYDQNVERAKQFENEAVIGKSVNDVIRKADGVHICTPNHTHYDIAKRALESDVHVLVEKPMTMNSIQAYDLVELAVSNGLILQVGHIYRFANVIRRIKELYENNYFGDVYYFVLTWTHSMPSIENVDILWDLLPHPLDILHFVTGEYPEFFVGVGRAFRRDKPNEVVSLQALCRGGVFASIYLSWLCPIRRRTFEIVGSERSAIVECVKQEITVYGDDDVWKIDVKANNTIRDEALNFVRAIETGKSDPNSCIVGARIVELIEHAILSMM